MVRIAIQSLPHSSHRYPDWSWLSYWVLLDITSSIGGFRAPQRRCWNKPTRSRGSTTGSLQNPYTNNVWSAAGLQGEVWSRRQVCANVFGLYVEIFSPGHDELRAYPSL